MAKVSPYGMKRRPRLGFERTFVDSLNPEQPITLTLRKMSKMEALAAIDATSQFTQQYVTGWGFPGHKGYIPPTLLPPIDGQPVVASSSTFQVATFLATAQCGPEADRYSVEELVSFMVSDELCDQFSDIVEELTTDEEEEDKEKEKEKDPLAPAASAATSPPSASTTEQPIIQESSATSSKPSGASTSD